MMKISVRKYFLQAIGGTVFVVLLFGNSHYAQSAPRIALAQDVRVDTSNTAIASKVAPGDLLPIAVKLLNFGSNQRVDVVITYTITDNKNIVVAVEHETVAVETTASFVKTFQIPQGIDSGIYVAHASIVYPDQITPATTQFSFTVEQRYLGLFEDDFITYGGFTIIVGLLMGILGHIFVRRVRASRFKPISYSDIPKDDRVFYELISDTILGMHEKVGDVAFDIAGNIPGMKIDKDTGRVLSLSDRPSKIVAALVAEYEKVLGKKVSFALRQEK